MTDIEIRDFAPADGPAVIALARELQAHESTLFDRMKPPDEIGDWYLDGLLGACREHGGRLLVAAQEDRLLGYAVVLTALTSEDEADERLYGYAAVRDLAVAETARGRGLGARLLAACEAIAREAGARWLRVTALAGNAGALRTYERFGFEPLFVDLEKRL